jgi:predicted membrane-bound spermidine synthase
MPKETNRADAPETRHYAGIFLLSLATLLLELSLTRVLSVALWYHFGFLIISTALLGFAASGVALALSPALRDRQPLDRALCVLSLAFGAVAIASFALMQYIPFDPFSLLADPRQLLLMPVYYVVAAAPFFCSGLAIALLLTRGGARVNVLYAFDLTGAGLGCAAVGLVMPVLGGQGSVVLAAALGLLAAVVFGFRRAHAFAAAGALAAAAALVLALVADRALPLAVTANKMHFADPPIYTAWNTFSRIDVFQTRGDPLRNTPPARTILFDAGTAATTMYDLRPDVRTALARATSDSEFESGVAYIGKAHPSVLIIGSGAGDQVLDALRFGASSITAVEVNPIVNEIVSRRMRDYWGGLFQQPGVTLVTDEGRSFVRRSRERYDAILSVHTISNAAMASGALSLAENYVLTREAFEDYLDHLTPDGVIFFTRPEAQLARLFATAREVFDRRGLGSPADHLFAYRRPPPASTRMSFGAGFLLKKTPFTPEEVREIESRLGFDGASPRGVEGRLGRGRSGVLYSPLEPRRTIYRTLLIAPDVRAVYAAQAADLAPATDDRPFFNHRTRWSRVGLDAFTDVFKQEDRGRIALEDRPVAEVALLTLLLQAVLVAAGLILAPLVRFSRDGLATPSRARLLVYFAGLGLGFITIEIALLQRFTLFLGQPVYTYAVVLASLLVFTGAGAYLAGRFRSAPRRTLTRVLPLVPAALLLTALGTPAVFSAALGLALGWRIVLSVLLIAPLGFLLGMPFPTGLRIAAAEAPPLVPWAWGVNGFFTVIGSVAALMLGMALGFRLVLAIAAGFYLVAWAAIATALAKRARDRGSVAERAHVCGAQQLPRTAMPNRSQ